MKTPFGVEIISEPAYTYRDYILLPCCNQNLKPDDVKTTTHLAADLVLNIPIVGSNMGHLGGRMAEKLAQLGGIGILSQDFRLDEILQRIRRVKDGNPYFHMPIVLTPEDHSADALAFMTKRHFDCVIVVDANFSPIGLATQKDLMKLPTWEQLKNVMKKDLFIVRETISTEEASNIMVEKQIHHLPVVNSKNRLLGCLTPMDITLRLHGYQPALDKKGRLLVGVAMGMKEKESQHPFDLAHKYIQEGVDVLVLDVANGYLTKFVEFAAAMRREIGKDFPIIAGNVADYEGAMRLLDAGCNTVKVGIGPGGACTTRRETGVGVPQATAVHDAMRACRKISFQLSKDMDRFILADGGIRGYRDLATAILLGASAVMIGSLLAGTYESAFESEMIKGETWKRWRGNAASSAATYRRKEIYGEKYITEELEHSEGADGLVKVTGSVAHIIFRLVEGLKRCMAYSNTKDIATFQEKCSNILRITSSLGGSFSHISQLELQSLYIKPQPSEVASRKLVQMDTQLTSSLGLHIPYVALPADFVQKKICSILAQLGGIGFLSRKKPNEEIHRMVERVEKVKSGHPLYFFPSIQQRDEEIGKTLDFLKENAFSCVIIVRDFHKDWTPIGIATYGDLLDHPRTNPLYEVVTSNIFTVPEGVELHKASDFMLEKGIHHLPVVNTRGELVGCITPRDITLRVFYGLKPNTDVHGRLRVGVALHMDNDEKILHEAILLDEANVDILLLDTDNGYSVDYLRLVKMLKEKLKCPVMAAGVTTYEGAIAAFEAGADVLKVGSLTIKVPYLESISECRAAADKYHRHIMTDDYGTITYPREANISLLMGASAVGLRNVLAPTYENSVQSVLAQAKIFPQKSPKLIKKIIQHTEYLMEDLENPEVLPNVYAQIQGSVINVIARFVNGLKSSCTYSNAADLHTYQHIAIIGVQSMEGYSEGDPHAFSNAVSSKLEYEKSPSQSQRSI